MHITCQNIFLALINRFLRFITLDNLRKNGANTFVHWKTAFFLKFVFSATSQVLKKLLLLAHYLSKNLSDSYKLFPEVYHTRQFQNIWGKYICSLENCLFFKNLCFQQPLRSSKNSYYLHIKRQNIFLSLMNRFLRFVRFNISKKIRANTFLDWKDCVLSKNMCFKQPISSQRNNPITCTINAKIPCGA